MKLKALVYQQKEWNPLQLSTGFPVFPVENITEEALAVWKLHAEEVLLITPTDAGIQAAVRAHMAVAAYADPAFPEQSYAGAWMVIEGSARRQVHLGCQGFFKDAMASRGRLRARNGA